MSHEASRGIPRVFPIYGERRRFKFNLQLVNKENSVGPSTDPCGISTYPGFPLTTVYFLL